MKDNFKALGHLQGEIKGFVESEAGNGRLKAERELLAKALADAEAIGTAMVTDLMAADVDNGGDIRNVYKVGLNTTRLLMVLGDIVCAWLMLRGAEVALAKLDAAAGDTADDRAFYDGKIAAAQWFARNVLPGTATERVLAESVSLDVMDLPEESF